MAAEHFRAALDQRPGDPDATYGYGYALLRLGQPDRARVYLCQAQAAGGPSTREIRGLMRTHGLACD